jgi:hypothetical protein
VCAITGVSKYRKTSPFVRVAILKNPTNSKTAMSKVLLFVVMPV